MPRRTRWIDSSISFDVASGGQNTQTLFPGIGPDDLRDSTIIRIVARLYVSSISVAGAWGIQMLAMGIGVISQEAIGAGIFPDPVNPVDFPVRGWLYKGNVGLSQNGSQANPLWTELLLSLKSQRKLDTGQPILIVDSTPHAGTAFTSRVAGSVRTLVLLP